MNYIKIQLIFWVAISGSLACANIQMPSIFDDNMVLQQDTYVSVWGTAQPSEKVSVSGSWHNSSREAVKAGCDGKWLVKTKTTKAGLPASPFRTDSY